jgi:tetratricopeptide (TPR) repeat protein
LQGAKKFNPTVGVTGGFLLRSFLMTESQLHDLLQSAAKHHQAAKFEQAEQIYNQILASDPRQPDALHRLGYLRYQQGKQAVALELIEQAIQLRPQSAEFACNHGVVLGALGRSAEAIAEYERAAAIKPDFAMAYFNIGCAWQAQGEWAKCEEAYQKALAIRPDYCETCVNLGGALHRQGKFDQAVVYLRRACTLQPNFAGAHLSLGSSLRGAGDLKGAIQAYNRAIEIRPDYADAHNNLGVALRESGRLADAMQSFKRAAELQPNDSEAVHNAAVTLHSQWRLEPAIAAYRHVVRLRPNAAEYLHNLAMALFEHGELDEATALFRQSVAIKPENAVMHWSLACALLSQGNFEEGLEEFEWRLAVKSRGLNRGFAQPQWDGSSAHGKTILLHAEGGHGDAIQYIRYLPMLYPSEARLILECQPALISLFRELKGIETIVPRGQELPAFDFHIPLIGLPRVMGTTLATIPANVPYLQALPDSVEKFRERLPADGQLKVGLVWSGKSVGSDVRTNTLQPFAPLAEIPGVQFVSLQTGPQASGPVPPKMSIINFSDELKDFSDLAGLLSHLDLLISVDTSVAHLAGAMAKPVWTLIPVRSDPRWLLNREDSPWYPTMRLFRQNNLLSWVEPFAKLAEALKELAAKPRLA